MAAVALAVQPVVRTGLDPVYTAMTVDGVEFQNNEDVLIVVKNSAASAAVVTIATPATYSGLTLADLTVSVPASGTRFIGPFPRRDFNNSAGKVTVTTDTITTTTIAAVSL